jgi:ankyrin repeat protein
MLSVMQEDALEALIAANANKGATAMDDMNALHFAAQNGHTRTSRILITNGGPPDLA